MHRLGLQLCTVVGQREVILKNAQHFGVNVKPAKTGTHVKLEDVLFTWFREVTAAGVNMDVKLEDVLLTWFREVTAAGVNMSGKGLREKAYNVALFLGIDNSQASGEWLHRFKEWHGLVYRVVSREAKKVDKSQMNGSLNTLLALISDYAPCDIFNGDKVGLFFNLQLESSLCVKG